jgi:hypothetical protein
MKVIISSETEKYDALIDHLEKEHSLPGDIALAGPGRIEEYYSIKEEG